MQTELNPDCLTLKGALKKNNHNDILKQKDEDELNIILNDNDLDTAKYQLKQVGFESHFKYNAGKVTEFKMSLKHLMDKKQKTQRSYIRH